MREALGVEDAGIVGLAGEVQGRVLGAAVRSRRQAAHALVDLRVANDRLLVALEASPEHARHGARHDVLAIAYRPEASTVIARGENAGRTLKEFNIVRAVHQMGTWEGHPARFGFPVASLPGDASKLAVLLQESGQGAVAPDA